MITTADAVDWAVLELTSRALGEGRADHVDFDAAVLTNVSEDHLDIHGTIDDYVAAKGRLFHVVPSAVPSGLSIDEP